LLLRFAAARWVQVRFSTRHTRGFTSLCNSDEFLQAIVHSR
jgi:hypothetical protein